VANHLNADMFVSVHANAFTNNAINGFETYYHPSDVKGKVLAEELGLNVNWDNDTRTALIDAPKAPETNPEKPPVISPQPPLENVVDITNVRVEMKDAMPQIRIKASSQVDYKELKLINPERLVIDLNNAKFNFSDKAKLEPNGTLSIQTDSGIIKGVRVSQFQNDPFITRVVMELGKSTDHKITFDTETGEIVVDFVNYIRDVKKESIHTKEVIVIEGDAIADYSIIKLSNPERLAVDIKGRILHSNLKNKIMNVDGKVAKTIRISQFELENNLSNQNTVRVVIDLQENSHYEEPYAEIKDGKLNIHLEGEPFKAIQYEETGWTTSRLTLVGSVVTRYSLGRQLAPNLIEVVVPKNDIELELASLNIDDHIIKSIDIAEDANKSNYTIKLELQDSVEYNLASEERSKDFVLELNNRSAKYREMLVVIDPGHGGSDPGAISISKQHESEIVLDIALRYNQLLTEAGFRTYMTRVDNLNRNTKLSLQERVDVANHLNADMFVSVHANAFTNNAINGFETYYHPSDIKGKGLAEIFQNEVISNVPINSRGAKAGDLFVLKHTTMPSVLVETGFLSNASDEAKLLTTQYRQQVAEAMVKATIRYFEERR